MKKNCPSYWDCMDAKVVVCQCSDSFTKPGGSEINWERLRSAQKVWAKRNDPTVQLSLLTDAGADGKLQGRLSLDSEPTSLAESFQAPRGES